MILFLAFFMLALSPVFGLHTALAQEARAGGRQENTNDEARTVPGLTVNGFDWGRKRVGNAHHGQLQLHNTSPGPVQIIEAGFKGGDTSMFTFPFEHLRGYELPETGILVNSAVFNPRQRGVYAATIYVRYRSSDGEEHTTEAVFQGVGVKGRVEMHVLTNFADAEVGGGKSVGRISVMCFNGPFEDSLRIRGHSIMPLNSSEGEFSLENAVFRLNGDVVNVPVILQPGERVIIDSVEFRPRGIGNRTAWLSLGHDGDGDTEILLSANAVVTSVGDAEPQETFAPVISPNPLRGPGGTLSLGSPPGIRLSVEIYSSAGRLLIARETTADFTADSAFPPAGVTLAPGAYFCSISTGGQTRIVPFLVAP